MPVRIYDISKKLGLENKEVLSKAKELGIAAARVASSSLDKITAEYLEQQLVLAHPDLAHGRPTPATAAPVVNEKILIVSEPPPPAEESAQENTDVTSTATAVLEPEPSVEQAPETEALEESPVAVAPVPPPVEAPAPV